VPGSAEPIVAGRNVAAAAAQPITRIWPGENFDGFTGAMQQLKAQPVIIGIVGDSAAGKTTMAAGLAEILGPDRSVIICTDDYIKHNRAERAALGMTAHDPECNYIDILEQHVELLREGQPVLKPVYQHHGGMLQPPVYVRPRPFIIIEGMLGYSTQHLRDAYDVKFYLDPPEGLRVRWKFQRDTTVGGYTVEQVMASLDRLNRDSARHVVPQRSFADMVISFYPPPDRPEETGAGLNVRHILSPTLPQIDLGPVLEAGNGRVFEMELARDADGRPADALQISGAVEPNGAKAAQSLLWQSIADGRPLPAHLGAFHDADYQLRISDPLALSQLLLTRYLLTAAHSQHHAY
jgi:phosphoribulokinase